MTARESRQSGPRVLIVGAGIAGLAAGRVLIEAGHRVILLDKGRGVGGRTAVRRRDGFSFDHGAQYVTARDERFRRLVIELEGIGEVRRWEPRTVELTDGGPRRLAERRVRYVGVPGMNAIAKYLARGLDVRCDARVARLERRSGVWRAFGETGGVLAESDVALVTTPSVQAVPLLADAPELASFAAGVPMHPCWAVLIGLESALDVAFDAARSDSLPLAWIARGGSKPGRSRKEAWILHASPEWSAEHLEADRETVARELMVTFSAIVGVDVDPSGAPVLDAHRWRYARGEERKDGTCHYDAHRRVGVAGDWCRAPRVEDAFLSGLAVAERVLAETTSSRGRGR